MSVDQLPYLDTFAKTAELSNFSAAARSLGVSQAAVSQRIQILEEGLKVQLFDRHGGQVVLTELGHRLYFFAQRILMLHREAVEKITGHKSPLAGELDLAASSVPGEYLLPKFLATFHQLYPYIQVRASVTDTKNVLKQVEHGQVQLGLVGSKCNSPQLEFRAIARDKLVVVVPAKHPFAGKSRITLAQLLHEPVILRECGSGSRSCLEQALAREGKSLNDLRVTLELGSNEAIKEAVLRSLGIAVLSERTIEKEVRSGKLCAIAVTGLDLSRDLFMTWNNRRVIMLTTQLFLDVITANNDDDNDVPEIVPARRK